MKEEIIEKYKRGIPVKQLAKENSLSRERIYQFLRQGNITRKRSLNTKHNKSEKFIINLLEENEIPTTDKKTDDYDILTLSGKKIEVKHRAVANSGYFEALVFNVKFVDFVIFITGELENSIIYIIPASECPSAILIPEKPKRPHKREKYISMWNLIKMTSN